MIRSNRSFVSGEKRILDNFEGSGDLGSQSKLDIKY